MKPPPFRMRLPVQVAPASPAERNSICMGNFAWPSSTLSLWLASVKPTACYKSLNEAVQHSLQSLSHQTAQRSVRQTTKSSQTPAATSDSPAPAPVEKLPIHSHSAHPQITPEQPARTPETQQSSPAASHPPTPSPRGAV